MTSSFIMIGIGYLGGLATAIAIFLLVSSLVGETRPDRNY